VATRPSEPSRPSVARPWLARYDAGVPAEIEVPEGTLDGLARAAAQRDPDGVALDFLGARTSFAELDDAINRFARALTGLGLRGGQRVSLHLPTCPPFVVALLGTMRAGGIAVPMNPLYTEHELAGLMEQATPALSVALDLVHPRVAAARAEVGGEAAEAPIVCVGIHQMLPAPIRWLYPLKARREKRWRPVADGPATPSLPALLARTPEGPVEPAARAGDPALLQPTGGTTGLPKLATLSHRNLVANAAQTRTWLTAGARPGDVMLCALPFFHIYGLTVAMSLSLMGGMTQVMLPRFDAGQVLKTAAKTRPRFFPGAPVMYAAVADHPRASRYDLTSIECCVSGAAPLPPDVQQRFEAATGARMVEGYGLSEASPVTHCNPLDGERRSGSIGLPFPSTGARIVDLETRSREVAPGEPGELQVRGPQVMEGYWGRPEETASVLRDGWLATGDVATMDEDGYFRIVDRLKDLIIVGGLNVYPREVEEVLTSHPAVDRAAVVAMADERQGEVPQAFVTLRPGAVASADELIAHCGESLARYKVPRRLELRDELPVTFIGKVLRRELGEGRRAG
jgi:long-chain acyl-CoA synthetase